MAAKISTTQHYIDHKSVYLQHYTFRDKSAHVHYGRTVIYPISKDIHVKQDAGGYFHISSFNGTVIHFQVMIYIIFGGNL